MQIVKMQLIDFLKQLILHKPYRNQLVLYNDGGEMPACRVLSLFFAQSAIGYQSFMLKFSIFIAHFFMLLQGGRAGY